MLYELNRASNVAGLSFVADLFDVSLDECVDLLNVDFAGLVVADLIQRKQLTN